MLWGHGIKYREFLAVEFTPDGRLLTVSQSDQTVRHLDTKSWKESAAYKWKIGRVECIAYAPDGMKGAGGGNKGVIVVWDMDR
jgi:WD40 repeat protein